MQQQTQAVVILLQKLFVLPACRCRFLLHRIFRIDGNKRELLQRRHSIFEKNDLVDQLPSLQLVLRTALQQSEKFLLSVHVFVPLIQLHFLHKS